MSPEDVVRRRAAKRLNERVKLSASALSTLGIAVFITGFLAPLMGGRESSVLLLYLGLLNMVVLHAIGQALLTAWRSED